MEIQLISLRTKHAPFRNLQLKVARQDLVCFQVLCPHLHEGCSRSPSVIFSRSTIEKAMSSCTSKMSLSSRS